MCRVVTLREVSISGCGGTNDLYVRNTCVGKGRYRVVLDRAFGSFVGKFRAALRYPPPS